MVYSESCFPPPPHGKILNHLKILKGDRNRIQNFQSTGEDEIQALLVREVSGECSMYLCSVGDRVCVYVSVCVCVCMYVEGRGDNEG